MASYIRHTLVLNSFALLLPVPSANRKIDLPRGFDSAAEGPCGAAEVLRDRALARFAGPVLDATIRAPVPRAGFSSDSAGRSARLSDGCVNFASGGRCAGRGAGADEAMQRSGVRRA